MGTYYNIIIIDTTIYNLNHFIIALQILRHKKGNLCFIFIPPFLYFEH